MKHSWPLFIVVYLLSGVSPDAYGQQKPVYNIGVLVDMVTPVTAPLFDQLESEIRAVAGEDAELNFPEASRLSNEFDVTRAEQNYQALLDNETDIILAFGQINNEVISRRDTFPKPTILFGAINIDLVDLAEDERTSGIDNFNYIIIPRSYRNDLESFRSIYAFEHVAVLVQEGLANLDLIREEFDEIFEDLGAPYTLVPYENTSSLEGLSDDVDAVYLAEGFYLSPQDIETLADTLFHRGLPSFTSTRRQDVELGLMASTANDENLNLFFRRIALNVESVINGVNLAELPIYLDINPVLTMNWNTADKTGVSIKYSMAATIEFVGDFENVISEKTYSLADLIDEVREQNLILGITSKDVELAEQELRGARSLYLPAVTATATGTYVDRETAEASQGQNPEYAADGTITFTQTLFSEAANTNVRIQRDLTRAERENLTAAEFDLILNAANIYFNVLILKANLQIQSDNLNVTRQNLQIAEQNFDAGQAGQSDVLRFRSEMAQNMQSLIEAFNQLEQGFYALNEIVNQPIDREIDVEEAEISEGVFEEYRYDQFLELLDDPSIRKIFVDFLVQEALTNAPELKALSYNIDVVDRNILLNGGRRFLPTVAAQAQYNRSLDQWGAGVPPPAFRLDDNFSVGLSVSVPIFDQNLKNINRQQAIIQKEQLTLSQSNTQRAIERDVKDAVLDMVNQISNIQLSQVSEEAARQSLELTQAAYSSGAVNLVQLLDAQNNLLQAQLARSTASYNFLLATLLLERTVGYFFLLHDEEENAAFVNRFTEYLNGFPE